MVVVMWRSILLGAIFAAAATPPVYIDGTRVIVVFLILLVLTFFQLGSYLARGRGFSRGLLIVLVLLSLSLMVSSAVSSIAWGAPNIFKTLVLLFQYSSLMVGYVLFDKRKLPIVGWVVLSYSALYGMGLWLQALGYLPGADMVVKQFLGLSFHRAQLFFDQPNGAAAYLSITVPLTFLIQTRGILRKTIITGLRFLLLLGLLATFSRSALMSLILGRMITFFLHRFRWFKYVFMLSIFTLMIATVVRPIFIASADAVLEVGNLRQDYSARERIKLMQAGLSMFYDHPVLGVGAGNYREFLPIYDTSLNSNLGIPHNTVIQFAAEQGILGLLAYLFTLFAGIKVSTVRDNAALALAWAFWSATINAYFGWQFIHGIGELYMLILGMLFAYESHTRVKGNDCGSSAEQGAFIRRTC